jgi:DNA-binding MarR family transcriptional regulator
MNADTTVRLPDVLQFMRLLWALEHGLQKASKRMAGQLGVTGPQRLVVRIVGLSPGISAGEIAKILHVHPSTLTGVLSRLTEQRLIVRREHERDRRRAVLHLTSQGRTLNGERRGTVEAAVRAALRGLSDRERAVSRRVFERLCESLEDGAQSYL